MSTPLSWRLIVQSGSLAGQTLTIQPGAQTIGRVAGNDFVLPEPSVADRHAQVTLQAEGCWIADLGSNTGTFVNGQYVAGSTWLCPGDEIQVGAVVLSVQTASADGRDSGLVCPRCGAVNRPGVRFCKQCALSLTAPQPRAQVTCSRCGAANRPAARFCQRCAAPLVQAGDSPEPYDPSQKRAPSRKRRKRRGRWLVAGSTLVLALAIVGLGAFYILPAMNAGPEQVRLPGVGDWSTMTEEEARQIALTLIEEDYPDWAELPPVVHTQNTGPLVYDVVFSSDVPLEGGGSFPRAVIVSIDTDNQNIVVFETN